MNTNDKIQELVAVRDKAKEVFDNEHVVFHKFFSAYDKKNKPTKQEKSQLDLAIETYYRAKGEYHKAESVYFFSRANLYKTLS